MGRLLERCGEIPKEATLITPISNVRFRVTDVRTQWIILEDTDTGQSPQL